MKKPMEKHLTLREKILENIRDAIISGSLKAGSRVSEPELAERYGISRTPIREAFRQLESEGYLTVIPRRGAVVSEFSQKDVEEFYAIKSILEGYAARCACEKLTPKELDRLQAINDRLADLASHNDVKTFFKIHNDFHDLFIKAADNEKLRELITSVVNRFQRLRLMSLSLPERMRISVQEHEKIIDAFRRKDAATAEALVRLNAEYGGRVLVSGHTPSPQTNEKQISPQLVGQGWLH
ncbi:MAG: GntR family transcriptional regulator [Geobacteraceae bacterium GWB2_52_12]|nr:MAG: GntR family transcriptional regulator [Geobacteraceae bacterium GWB2_52_12]